MRESPQSPMPFGLPLRTRNTIKVDVSRPSLLFGNRLSQFTGNSLPAFAMPSTSAAKAQRDDVSPEGRRATERACLPEPPCG